MSIRLASQRIPNGRDAASIRKWMLIFLTAGIVGRAVIQNRLLNMSAISMEELLDAMDADPMVMIWTTVALICKLAESCAAPLTAFLLVEGFQRTSSFEKYLVRVAGLALVTELPYNLAINGGLLHLGSRNPVFGLLICLVMLHFFCHFSQKGMKNTLIKAVIFAAAFLWCLMLRIDHGIQLVIFTGILWLSRTKGNLRSLYAFSGAMACTMFDTYYMGACLACIMLHRYNEERGEQNVKFNYAFYPVCLLVVGIAAKMIG